jgi:hypothetical protein
VVRPAPLLMTALISISVASAAQAQMRLINPFPRYSPDDECAQITQPGAARSTCVSQEQKALTGALQLWPDINARNQAKCQEIADEPVLRRYSRLENCLAQVGQRDAFLDRPTFRR